MWVSRDPRRPRGGQRHTDCTTETILTFAAICADPVADVHLKCFANRYRTPNTKSCGTSPAWPPPKDRRDTAAAQHLPPPQ